MKSTMRYLPARLRPKYIRSKMCYLEVPEAEDYGSLQQMDMMFQL